MKVYLVVESEFLGEVFYFPAYKTKDKAAEALLALVDKRQKEVVEMKRFYREEEMEGEDEYKDFHCVSENQWKGGHYDLTDIYIKEIEVV